MKRLAKRRGQSGAKKTVAAALMISGNIPIVKSRCVQRWKTSKSP